MLRWLANLIDKLAEDGGTLRRDTCQDLKRLRDIL